MQILLKLSIILISTFGSTWVFGQKKSDSLALVANKLGEQFLLEKQGIGISIGIFHNGRSHFFNFGSTQKSKAILPSQNTVYEIGSITKTFISFILANAVKEGKVNLDDDIRKYLKGSYPNLEFKGHCIKLVHLANTTSLLPDWLPEKPSGKGLSSKAAQKKQNEYFHLTKKDFLVALHTIQLDTIPGTKTHHSNAAAQLLAYILEDVYNKSMDKLIEFYITNPQNMSNTSFFISPESTKLAAGYSSYNEPINFVSSTPYIKYAGGLTSTTEDLVRYIQLMLSKDNPPSKISLTKTIDINASNGKIVAPKPDGVVSPEIYSCLLNWFKYHPQADFSQIWSDGGTDGFNSYLVLYPNLNSGVVILANKSDEKIFQALPRIAYQISKFLD